MDIFEGTPKEKFFDIIFNANRNLVEENLEELVFNFITLTKICEQNGIDISSPSAVLIESLDDMEDAINDYYIEFTSNVLSNNE
ncbi:DUF2018 domain-containing protein [Campylobacter blaseri]|uniref:DUF2018 domain-containing protein n=1 Tax=Campylobacter blaseri TaxID=2042961 RepID=A0A2P8QZL0_9BACT|nr:DUF2018 family protein [Campylobacter blaseri]PSM51672.1 hypothetical protein CQ405_05945 [Campylobacter blaseri]PSM53462.1 hypothetical protein CRN67_05945 [Campylobacter blaseri]QKF86267.1 DUF2018 domain-containing protein [Campylobacter blaseri]